MKLRHAMEALYRTYQARGADSLINLSGFVPNMGAVREGLTVQVNAFDFTLHDKAWWITKIDLGKARRRCPCVDEAREAAVL